MTTANKKQNKTKPLPKNHKQGQSGMPSTTTQFENAGFLFYFIVLYVLNITNMLTIYQYNITKLSKSVKLVIEASKIGDSNF